MLNRIKRLKFEEERLSKDIWKMQEKTTKLNTTRENNQKVLK